MSNRTTVRKHKINDQIRCREVRLVGEGVEAGKVVSLIEAKKMASDLELDLVLINDSTDPYICKVIDYSKFIFEQNKKPKQPKAKPMKEMRYTPNTDGHDFEFKLNHVRNFLTKGHKVKAFVFFRGREMAHKERGEAMLLKLSVEVEDVGVPEAMPKFEGRKCTVILKPIKK